MVDEQTLQQIVKRIVAAAQPSASSCSAPKAAAAPVALLDLAPALVWRHSAGLRFDSETICDPPSP